MRFAKPSGVRGLGFLTCLSAVNAALILRVHQDRVNGTVGQSVLLPVSYTDPDPRGYLRIIWTRTAHVIIQHTRFSGKDGDHRSRTHITISDPYKHRAVLFPKNASLLLNDLQVNDSGIYELSIGLLRGMEKRSMTLTVWPDTTDGADTRNRNDTGNQNYIWNGSDTLDTTDTDKKQIPFEANARYVSLVVIFIFLCFTVKTCRGCGRAQERQKRGMFLRETGTTLQ
ncbi:HEPACAM family member 2-like [Hemitrygon akajei]|uniref:HEPACAM family member 2-like n=1 Tax=Hemitrygon akajei TaxID=2704970 RepID=UPI003BF9509C